MINPIYLYQIKDTKKRRAIKELLSNSIQKRKQQLKIWEQLIKDPYTTTIKKGIAAMKNQIPINNYMKASEQLTKHLNKIKEYLQNG